jgi:hypothetical protein
VQTEGVFVKGRTDSTYAANSKGRITAAVALIPTHEAGRLRNGASAVPWASATILSAIKIKGALGCEGSEAVGRQ